MEYSIEEYEEIIQNMMYYLSGFTQYLYDEVYKHVYDWLMTAEDLQQVYLSLVVVYGFTNGYKALQVYEAHKADIDALNPLTPASVHEYMFVHSLFDFYDYNFDDIVATIFIYAKAKGVYNMPSYMYHDYGCCFMYNKQELLSLDTDFIAVHKDWFYNGHSYYYTLSLIYALHTYQKLTGSNTFDTILNELKRKHVNRKVLKYMFSEWDTEKLLNRVIEVDYDDRFKYDSVCFHVKEELKFNYYYYVNKDDNECMKLINDMHERMCTLHENEDADTNEDIDEELF